tara:strand:- start:169 stop:480 length:312 start_codon:yes stop_codon:yes gene_type:complete
MIIRKNVQISRITTDHVDLKSVHRSTLVKHGKSFEQLFPYMSSYPYDMNNFRFIGSPIDGLSFEDNSVVFVEFKTGKSKLTKKQERVKKLIKDKKVEWKEIRA